jgi:beta-phosphoglucomutase-like phosphatase (HAD superfamily)
MTDFLMQPLFIVFDLDGTLLDVGTRQLVNGVKVSISQLKSQGHFLSVCSNNVMAKEILYELGILDQFDYIVGHASTSFKSVELLSCWAYYRYLYHTKLIRWKIHLNRIVFVDDDEENLEEVRHQFKCITAYSGIAQLLANLSDRCKPAAVSFQLVRSTIARRWGFASQVTEQRMLIPRDQSAVFINATAKRDDPSWPRYVSSLCLQYHGDENQEVLLRHRGLGRLYKSTTEHPHNGKRPLHT